MKTRRLDSLAGISERTGFTSRPFNVKTYSQNTTKSHAQLSGFVQNNESIFASGAPATVAGKYVHHRFNVRPIIADLIASLAGLGPDRSAA
jgi:hypothetical protein